MNRDLKDKGYFVIKKFFSKQDVDAMRSISIPFFKKGGGFKNSGGVAKPDWIKEESLSGLLSLCDIDRIKSAVSKEVGEEVFFIEHNDLHINRSVGWHKDRLNGKTRAFEKTNPWTSVNGETMKIFKVNIYLQDHKIKKNGLIVKEGSHLSSSMNAGSIIPIESEVGDLVLFDQRITHQARTATSNDRVLICFGFGVKNIFFDEFKAGTIFRQEQQSRR